MRSFWINRTLCDVLAEMRKSHETRNYANLEELTEEANSYFLNMVLTLYVKDES